MIYQINTLLDKSYLASNTKYYDIIPTICNHLRNLHVKFSLIWKKSHTDEQNIPAKLYREYDKNSTNIITTTHLSYPLFNQSQKVPDISIIWKKYYVMEKLPSIISLASSNKSFNKYLQKKWSLTSRKFSEINWTSWLMEIESLTLEEHLIYHKLLYKWSPLQSQLHLYDITIYSNCPRCKKREYRHHFLNCTHWINHDEWYSIKHLLQDIHTIPPLIDHIQRLLLLNYNIIITIPIQLPRIVHPEIHNRINTLIIPHDNLGKTLIRFGIITSHWKEIKLQFQHI